MVVSRRLKQLDRQMIISHVRTAVWPWLVVLSVQVSSQISHKSCNKQLPTAPQRTHFADECGIELDGG